MFPAGGYSVYLLLASEALVVDGKAITMSDLEEAKELFMTLTKQAGVTEDASLQRAIVILLRDYIERAKKAKQEADD